MRTDYLPRGARRVSKGEDSERILSSSGARGRRTTTAIWTPRQEKKEVAKGPKEEKEEAREVNADTNKDHAPKLAPSQWAKPPQLQSLNGQDQTVPQALPITHLRFVSAVSAEAT